jgi:hypothetical protein
MRSFKQFILLEETPNREITWFVIPAKARLGARLSAKPREAWAGI